LIFLVLVLNHTKDAFRKYFKSGSPPPLSE
jgi:hypothetical protein